MTDELRVRVYNVLFGDAILISVPERDGNGGTQIKHILVDVGNAGAGKGSKNVVFAPVIKDIIRVLNGHPLDLYVMTHEHLDHVQGLLAASKGDPPLKFDVDYAWLTGSAAPGYSRGFAAAGRRADAFQREFEEIGRYVEALPAAELHPWVRALFDINDSRKTKDCVDYIKQWAPEDKTAYVYRGYGLAGKHPFTEAKLDIWAPEQNTAVYPCKLRPLALGVKPAEGKKKSAKLAKVEPPPGVGAEAFYNLVEMRRRGLFDNLLAIDAAENNTSIVFSLQWRGWTLLFAGDAETESWDMMAQQGVLAPVDFLKVSHHGSSNGLPRAEQLDIIMPRQAPARPRRAVVSTFQGTHRGVPARKLLDEQLGCRCEELCYVEAPAVADGRYKDFKFEG
ncbi:MAG: hypothetical protein JSU81_05585 [Candidatus Coatesbacteria bacterium]|nr:MAG: hypothetical protein JSU81_05585 [Candidatus Coatesbacteria bacterium]